MYAQSRIPKLQDTTPDGALLWSELEFRGQLFHPEDDPSNIVSIASSAGLFTDVEVHELRYLINPFDKNSRAIANRGCLPIFMNAFGYELDA